MREEGVAKEAQQLLFFFILLSLLLSRFCSLSHFSRLPPRDRWAASATVVPRGEAEELAEVARLAQAKMAAQLSASQTPF